MVDHLEGVKVELEKWDNGYVAYVSNVDEDVEHHVIYYTEGDLVKGVVGIVRKMLINSLRGNSVEEE